MPHTHLDRGPGTGSSRPAQQHQHQHTRWLTGLVGGFAALQCASAQEFGGSGEPSQDSAGVKAGKWIAIAGLVVVSGLCAGLTLGLMGLDKTGLDIVAKGGNPKEAAAAQKIIPLRKDGNLLLCTLLLGNVAINALLSIIMAGLTNGLVGFLLSTAIITVFGEIIPQALCSRHALSIGAAVVPVMRVVVMILWPITKPLAFVLDKMLGEEVGTIHSRTELRELLDIHVKHGALDVETGREVANALHYKDTAVRTVMTPKEEVFMLAADARLNYRTIHDVFKAGYSRIPVYGANRDDIVGLLLTKDLVFIDPEDETPVRNFIQIFGRTVHIVWPDQKLGDVLKMFKKGRAHMAIVRDVDNSGARDPYYFCAGVVTLEDIIEELLGEDILDEMDTLEIVAANGHKAARAAFDSARLHLLNASATEDVLSREEAAAVAAHLMANVDQLQGLERSCIASVVAASPVITLKRHGDAGGDASPEDFVYRRGRVSAACTLVLTGRLCVLAGKDEFQSDAGPWTVLAPDALLAPEGGFKPDFSAHVASETVRILRIPCATFAAACSGAGAPKQGEAAAAAAASPLSSVAGAAADSTPAVSPQPSVSPLLPSPSLLLAGADGVGSPRTQAWSGGLGPSFSLEEGGGAPDDL